MRSFNFTYKKFKAQKPDRQQKWIIKWLTDVYANILEGDATAASLEEFFNQYKTILQWCGEPGVKKPDGETQRSWVEFVSNRVQVHREALGRIPKEYDFLPRVITGDKDTETPWKPAFACKIALDGLRSVFNVGSVFRLCDGVGFEGIILGNTLGREHQGVRKTSMGAAEWIPQVQTDNLALELEKAAASGYSVIGVETVEGSVPHTEFEWPEKCVIVFGNEEFGISSEVLGACDDFVHIPMYGRKNSINVANAVSVICFHLCSELKKT